MGGKYTSRLTGRYAPRKIDVLRDYHNQIARITDMQMREASKSGPTRGPRTIFLERYRAEGFEKAAKEINKPYGRVVFSDEILNGWIEEEEAK